MSYLESLAKDSSILGDFLSDYEIKLPFGSSHLTVFISPSFFEANGRSARLHKHHAAEVQIYAAGRTVMRINGAVTPVETGEAVFIPKGMYHETLFIAPETVRCSFLVSSPETEIKTRRIPMQVIKELLLETDDVSRSKNFFKTSLYLSFILGYFIEHGSVEATKTADRAYAIREFFARNYDKSVRLYDLAGALGISPKHAARLVEKVTGNTFSDELTRHRISAAEQYMREGTHQLKDISERVGFHSYSGFWKAYKRFSTKQASSPKSNEKDN